MPFISITRLKVKSILYILKFLMANEASVKDLVKIKGFLKGKELIDKNLTFWTLTMWTDDISMKTFRNSVPHRKAMQNLPTWCHEASYFHWTQPGTDLPAWHDASERLISEGKLTKVRNPTPRHLANTFPPIKWTKLERVFKPMPVSNVIV